MLETKRRLNILDFDIETRPLSFWGDRPTAEITAIASGWNGDANTITVYLLGEDDPIDILSSFVDHYNHADMVTGHYIRKFDLPMINGALMEYGLPQLSSKLTCDTKLDMKKKMDIPATQEYLAQILGISEPKVPMGQFEWRDGNRLTPSGKDRTYNRAYGDVVQHMALRKKMFELGLLKAPRMWNP